MGREERGGWAKPHSEGWGFIGKSDNGCHFARNIIRRGNGHPSPMTLGKVVPSTTNPKTPARVGSLVTIYRVPHLSLDTIDDVHQILLQVGGWPPRATHMTCPGSSPPSWARSHRNRLEKNQKPICVTFRLSAIPIQFHGSEQLIHLMCRFQT